MTKKHKIGLVAPPPAEGPTLREFWMRLQREKAAREASGDTGADDRGSGGVIGGWQGSGRWAGSGGGSGSGSGPGSSSGPGSGWRWNRSGGSGWSWSRSGSGSGSGNGGLGYGLDLVVPDRFCRERILLILRDICAREETKE